jgi:hypothetical protein
VALDYTFMEGSETVRSVEVGLRCVECGQEKAGATFEIDYEPTDELVARPLDPCPEPWLKAKQSEISALWVERDATELVLHAGQDLNASCYFAAPRGRPALLAPRDVCARLREARVFNVYLSARELEFPDELRDAWRRLPVMCLASPIHMNYRTGAATLYFLRWANEFLVEGRVVPQEAPLLELASRVQSWLRSRYTAERGPRTADNPAEYERLKGGW